MSLDRDISLLSRVPMFSELNTEQLRLLAFSAIRLELVSKQVLFREGAKAMSGYVVATGKLELSVREGEEQKVMAVCEAGCLIGELALFVETKRPATATAAMATEVLEIDRKLVTRMLNEYPRVALRMRAKLADRLTTTVTELGNVRQALTDIDRPNQRR